MLSVSIFNVARYLTDSLRGPVLAHYSEADRPSLIGWDGWDGHQKCPLIFFILRYIKHYTLICLDIYIDMYIYMSTVFKIS